MVRLEKLELIGFKSFLSRTEFLLDKGITAVVGPNGCGKSNIGDALNWVIGEQSARTLRGDRMEDVIFNGTEGRRATGMAEVSLHLRNGAEAGIDEAIVITRRLFRSGESEYLLNGSRARLRDIQETLTRINVGSGLYAIIEQGKVDAALGSRPRERRILIEEAAGIAVYRQRKRQAEVKLEATEANLLRVNDIVSEIERQVGSLKRQAARARRYARTAEVIVHLERIVLLHDHDRLDRQRRGVQAREDAARAAEAEAGARAAGLDARHEEERRLLDEDEAGWRSRRDDLHALDRSLDQHERDLSQARDQEAEAHASSAAARERAAALEERLREEAALAADREKARTQTVSQHAIQEAECRRLEAARAEQHDRIAHHEAALAAGRADLLRLVDALSDARNHRRQAEEERDRAARRVRGLRAEQEAARAEAAEATRAYGETRDGLTEAERLALAAASELALARAEAERLHEAVERELARREEAARRLHAQEARRRALEEVEASSRGTRETLAGLASRADAPAPSWVSAGILSDGLHTPTALEAAAESYLREHLDAALVSRREDALAGLAALKATGEGRAAFLVTPPAPDEAVPQLGVPEDVRVDPDFVGRLGDLVETDDARRRALSAALARALVVTDLEAAARLRPHAPFMDFVTLDGDVLHAAGLVEGGARRPEGAGVLGRRRLRQELGASIEAGRSHLDSLDALLRGLDTAHAAAGRRTDALHEDLAAREKDGVALRHRADAASGAAERARSKLETIGREAALSSEELAALGVELERLAAVLSELEPARLRSEATIGSLQREVDSLRATLAQATEALAAARASLSALRERLDAGDAELARLREAQEDLRARLAREVAEQDTLARRVVESRARQEEAARAMAELGAGRLALQEEVSRGESDIAERRRLWEQRASEVRAARAGLEEARGRREQVSLEMERVSADLRHLVSSALGASPGATLEDLFAALTDEDRAREAEAVRTELADLRRRRDAMGPVNMMALEQFRELEERQTFLTAQRRDLQESIASLRETISRINRTSRERFMEAFERIRASFNELFASLFRGGRADLRLMTGEGDEDVLECGLEVIAQPPGKRLQNVSLLSGGEKALTAVALLFAIFRYRPSPFCLLDEVDAALDEANVLRFSELLRSMAGDTQFVLITHNRASMESAEVLYGITMEEPGVSTTISVVMEGESDKAETARTLPAQLAARHKGVGRRALVAALAAPSPAPAEAPAMEAQARGRAGDASV